MRTLSRFALIGLIGGATAACSTDAVRLDPFSNPFSSSASGEPGATGSLPEGEALTAPVRSAPIQSRPLAAPLAPPVTSRPLAAAPVLTPRVAATAPVTGGPAGWSAAGGTTITVGANDSLNQMSTRFGVPSAAILQANGLSSAAQVTAGRQIVIPVYHAGGVPAMSARTVPPAPRVQVAEARPVETRAPEPVRRVAAEVAPRPEPVRAEPPRREPEPARKAPVRPGQAEAKPVPAAAAERAAKLNLRKPEPREEEERVAVKAQAKAAAKVAARQQDDDEDDRTAAKPKAVKVEARKPEPKAEHKPEKVAEKAKPEVKKVAELHKPEPKKVEAKQVEAKVEAKKPEPKPVEAKAEVKKPEPKKVAEVKPEPKPEPAKPVKVAALPEKAPEPAPAPAVAPAAPEPQSTFRWPARGRVINGYGSSGNEGINIAVPEGTPVKAAEEGTVAYAGSDVKGYGKLVLVRHSNGYVSAYAHNGEIDVRPGEKVKRGQTIAKSGASGNVTSPQLHFEIRKGATPVDPMPHLASN